MPRETVIWRIDQCRRVDPAARRFDASDVFVCSRDVLALAGGGVSTATTPCTIPAGTAPGTYFLIGVADGGGAVQETNETNNTAAVSIRIS